MDFLDCESISQRHNAAFMCAVIPVFFKTSGNTLEVITLGEMNIFTQQEAGTDVHFLKFFFLQN